VRTNDAAIGAQVASLLEAHVVPDIQAPANLSMLVGEDNGPVREFHRLFRGGQLVARTRSRGRLVRSTLSYLDAFVDEPVGTVRLDARLLVRDGGAVLIDPMLRFSLERLERRLEHTGYRFADVLGAPVDREQLEVKLWPPRLEIDRGALEVLNREYPPEVSEFELAAVQLPVHALVLLHADSENGWSASRRLLSVTRLVEPLLGSSVAADDLRLARRLVDAWEVAPCPPEDAALMSLLRQG
jgi:hypothetical protein